VLGIGYEPARLYTGWTNKATENCRAWRDLYKAALFEGQRELFYAAGDNIEEGEALDDAIYALHALQNTSQTNHRMPPVV